MAASSVTAAGRHSLIVASMVSKVSELIQRLDHCVMTWPLWPTVPWSSPHLGNLRDPWVTCRQARALPAGWRVAARYRADRSVLSARRLRRAFAGGSGWPAKRLSRARIVVSELSKCSRSDSGRVLIAWAMTAWMAGSC